MLTPDQLVVFYPDLSDPAYTTHLAMVHSRFSTNTFPSWDRASRCGSCRTTARSTRCGATSTGCRRARAWCAASLFGDDLHRLFPIAEPDCSDSGSFDNVLEFLLMSGRTLQEAVMMMIPEAWQKHPTMTEAKRAFYEYHSALDGAVGRPGVDRLHRRQLHRRRAGSQRAASQPLLPDQGRSGDHGQRGGRAAHRSGERGVERSAGAGQDVPGGLPPGSVDPGRGIEARVREPAAVRRLAAQEPHPAVGPGRAGQRAGPRRRHAAGAHADVRLHHGNGPLHVAADGPAAARPVGLDGQRRRRWPA